MEAYTEEAVDAVIDELGESVGKVTKTINEAYAIQCSKGNIDTSEEKYRTFFIEFIHRIFDVKELSIKKSFDVSVSLK